VYDCAVSACRYVKSGKSEHVCAVDFSKSFQSGVACFLISARLCYPSKTRIHVFDKAVSLDYSFIAEYFVFFLVVVQLRFRLQSEAVVLLSLLTPMFFCFCS